MSDDRLRELGRRAKLAYDGAIEARKLAELERHGATFEQALEETEGRAIRVLHEDPKAFPRYVQARNSIARKWVEEAEAIGGPTLEASCYAAIGDFEKMYTLIDDADHLIGARRLGFGLVKLKAKDQLERAIQIMATQSSGDRAAQKTLEHFAGSAAHQLGKERQYEQANALLHLTAKGSALNELCKVSAINGDLEQSKDYLEQVKQYGKPKLTQTVKREYIRGLAEGSKNCCECWMVLGFSVSANAIFSLASILMFLSLSSSGVNASNTKGSSCGKLLYSCIASCNHFFGLSTRYGFRVGSIAMTVTPCHFVSSMYVSHAFSIPSVLTLLMRILASAIRS